jgi:Ca2+-binding EF-hand superfamily protein
MVQVAEYKEVFMLFDRDEDGVLSFPELQVIFFIYSIYKNLNENMLPF